MADNTRQYTNNEVTVVWKPDQCMHSKICWTQLRSVFDPVKRPWINMDGATTEKIIEQVRHCPSGALSYFMNTPAGDEQTPVAEAATALQVDVSANGPYLINTECLIKYPDGREERKKGKVALCRCGASHNKPYCDGSHKEINFVG